MIMNSKPSSFRHMCEFWVYRFLKIILNKAFFISLKYTIHAFSGIHEKYKIFARKFIFVRKCVLQYLCNFKSLFCCLLANSALLIMLEIAPFSLMKNVSQKRINNFL